MSLFNENCRVNLVQMVLYVFINLLLVDNHHFYSSGLREMFTLKLLFQMRIEYNFHLETYFPIPWIFISFPAFVFRGSHGIELTFLKLDSWSPGAGFSFYNLKCIKIDRERKNVRKKISFMHTKTFNAAFKNGFNPMLGSIPRLPFSE